MIILVFVLGLWAGVWLVCALEAISQPVEDE